MNQVESYRSVALLPNVGDVTSGGRTDRAGAPDLLRSTARTMAEALMSAPADTDRAGLRRRGSARPQRLGAVRATLDPPQQPREVLRREPELVDDRDLEREQQRAGPDRHRDDRVA